ncbi:hypothetical protein B0I29_110242 [Actinoplanes lutulentus]|uniref:Uncharacterized protein n=2 Tax=Actinoplanes lutulentus TaxID=1287878 RepID=A0A327Z975_9ACTN|nr:hypothetical protein B0I29_110242 [Actinoplanes lutulentus]
MAGCGAPPPAAPVDAPAPVVSAPSVAAIPSLPPVTFVPLDPTTTAPPIATLPTTYPTYPTVTATVPTVPTVPTTSPVTTTSPTPSPTLSHAKKCTGEPTGKQILALLKGNPAVPDATLKVDEGPFCSGVWSFTTVKLATGDAETLSVVTTGKGSTLTLVTAGTDVCNPRVQTEAPVGIRVLACGS